jgi:uncharacterized protein (TIGR00369 family)
LSALAAARAAALAGDFSGLIGLMPYARFLGVRAERSDGPLARSVLPFRDDLVGNTKLPAVHGGVTAAFMEHAAILQLLLALDQARLPKSIDFAIDYLLPARARDTYADCEVSRIGLRAAHTQIRCWQDHRDRPIAIARAHFLLITA